jgi:hypothetical protein
MMTTKISFEELDLNLSRKYAQIVLGMDGLYRANNQKSSEESLDKEGLVPINLTDVTPNAYSSWESVLEDFEELRQSYLTVGSDLRRNYMQQQIGSLIGLAKWCKGDEIPFREKVRSLLYVNENPFVLAEREKLHHELDVALTKRGFEGSIKDKYTKWSESQHVHAHQITSILKELLGKAKQQVVSQMFSEIEEVEVEPVVLRGVPYSAYCDYVGGKMYINGDLPYTYQALKHLVTHEAFPGHTTHMKMRDIGVQTGDVPLDFGMVITNTASSSVFEGIGDNGLDFINWRNTPNDEIHYIYQKIQSISGLNAAHMIHAEAKTDEEVRQFLESFAFGNENWINSRIRFFKHSLRAPFIYSYWRGFEAVNSIYQTIDSNQKERFFHFLYKNMLSADTVKQFG